jgi:hypothetical protein
MFLKFYGVYNSIYRSKKILFLISSINIFNFILKTRSTISGRSDGVRLVGRAASISAQAALDVKVTNKSEQPNFLQTPMQSWYVWYK